MTALDFYPDSGRHADTGDLTPLCCPLLGAVHRRRLSVLVEAVATTVSGPPLTLTESGRRFADGGELRHRSKRADRLLGNRHLQHESRGIYKALGRMLLCGVAEPLVVFRNMKSQQFGSGLECRASKGIGRFMVLVLIAPLAAILLWLIGTPQSVADDNQRRFHQADPGQVTGIRTP